MAEPRIEQNYFVPDSAIPRSVAITGLGSTPLTILGINRNRGRLIFHNPNETAKVAICPAFSDDGPVEASMGAGSIILFPSQIWELASPCFGSFTAVADAEDSGLTIWEF